jgi:hypothetical protein
MQWLKKLKVGDVIYTVSDEFHQKYLNDFDFPCKGSTDEEQMANYEKNFSEYIDKHIIENKVDSFKIESDRRGILLKSEKYHAGDLRYANIGNDKLNALYNANSLFRTKEEAKEYMIKEVKHWNNATKNKILTLLDSVDKERARLKVFEKFLSLNMILKH